MLAENHKLVTKYAFDKTEKEPLLSNSFWSAGTERMLIGFSLENSDYSVKSSLISMRNGESVNQ